MIVSDQATIESVPDRCLLWFFKCQRYHDAPALTTKGKCRMLDSRAKDRVSKRVNSPNRGSAYWYTNPASGTRNTDFNSSSVKLQAGSSSTF